MGMDEAKKKANILVLRISSFQLLRREKGRFLVELRACAGCHMEKEESSGSFKASPRGSARGQQG